MDHNDNRLLHGAFTLIELLVVIAIIAILTSMLLPVLQGARGLGEDVDCRNNIRQCGIMIMLYTDDADGYLPVSSDAVSNPKRAVTWYELGDMYSIPSDIMTCVSASPSNRMYVYASGVFISHGEHAVAPWTWDPDRERRYTANSNYMPRDDPSSHDDPFWLIDSIRKPSMLFAFVEGDTDWWGWHPSRSNRYRHRRNAYINLLMFDGHVESWHYKDTIEAGTRGLCNTNVHIYPYTDNDL